MVDGCEAGIHDNEINGKKLQSLSNYKVGGFLNKYHEPGNFFDLWLKILGSRSL